MCLRIALTAFFLIVAVGAQQCNTGLLNISLPDNGNVCDMLRPPDIVETMCQLTISGGLNAALAACADDTYIEISLTAGFSESGPFVFPAVRSITIFGNGTSLLGGAEHVVVGNHTALAFSNLIFAGGGTDQPLFQPGLRSNNLTLSGVYMYGYHGRWAVAMEGCEDDVRLEAMGNYFFDNWGASLFAAGLYEYNVQSNIFDRCGGNQFGATFLKTHWANDGTQVFFNNSQWLLFDEQPPLCIAFLDGGEHLRCRDGVFECEDLTATLIADDCPRTVNKTFIDPATNNTVWELLFQPFCRRYAQCQCEEVIFRDVSNVSLADFSLRVGDVIYPYVTLPCQPGDALVAGGAVGSVAPLEFQDPSFEDFVFPIGNTKWNTSSGTVILDNTVTKPKSRTGSYRVICPGKEDTWFEQYLNFTAAGAYLVSFWGARRDGQRNNFVDGFVELYLDGVQSAAIAEPSFFDTLVGDLTYYEFIFPSINVASAGEKLLRVRCNFVNTQNLEFAIDDIGSRTSGLEIVLFPPGQGLGPPLLADPVNYIAQPLATNSYIAPLPCPPCPDPPARPSDLPCDYVIANGFACFSTIFNGSLVCLDPDIFNAGGGGALIADPSMEATGNATVWVEVEGSPAIQEDTFLPLAARTGTHLLYVDAFNIVSIEQQVAVTQSGFYQLAFWGTRGNPNLAVYNGKQIQLFIDNVLVDTLALADIGSVLPAAFLYGHFFFNSQALVTGNYTFKLRLDWSGGPFGSNFAVDDIQFLAAFASASASQTPSTTPSASVTPSPSPVPVPGTNGTVFLNMTNVTLECNGTNITVPCWGDNVTVECDGANITLPCVPVQLVSLSCNGTNITAVCTGANLTLFCNGTNVTVPCGPPPPPTFPVDQLRCIEEQVYLGDAPFAAGCIVPSNLLVPFNGNNVTANSCVTILSESGCVLPEMFEFTINDTVIVCVSLSLGMMSCDCSTEKLISEFVNRTITADACAYEFDEIPATAAAFFIRENRAQQLDYGGCSRRIEYDTVVASSVARPDYFDERGVAREILKQSNQLWGRIPDVTSPNGVRNGPRFLQDGLIFYEQVCEDNCPMANPTIPGTNIPFCIVDAAGADFVASGSGNVFATVQEAIDDDNCTKPGRAIDVRNTENFYEEDLQCQKNNIILFSSTNATIVGTHVIKGNVNVFFSRGLRWIHNGRNGQPLFDIDRIDDLTNFTLYNNDFPGDGVKDGGIIRNRGKKIRHVDFRYNLVRDYQSTSLRFDAVDIIASHNTFRDCSGRLLQARYEGTVKIEHNVYIDSRGAPDIKKPAMFELHFRGRRDTAPCNVDSDQCALRRNVQLEVSEEPEDSPDYKETGLLLRDGAFFIETLRDNLVIKARTGLRLRKVDVIVDAELSGMVGVNQFLELFQYYNPLVRPSRTRREKDGEDFMVDGFFEGSRFSRIACSFPDCVPPSQQPKRCVANLNFESFYSEQFGWETYTNTSQASFYCSLPVVNVTVFGGARIIPERLAVRRPFSNNIQRPLLDEPTNEEILLGLAPVPNRFTIQGVQVQESDVPFYASLLDANNTYGFGDGQQVFVQTDLVCSCQAVNIFTGQPALYVSRNCTTLIGIYQDPTLCATALAAEPNATACYVGDDSQLNCTMTGALPVGVLAVKTYDCSLPLFLTFNTTGNNTLVNETRYVTQTGILGDLETCILEPEDIFTLEFREGTLNLCIGPAYYSVGSNFRALNITWRDVEFYLHYGTTVDEDEVEQSMLATLEPAIDLAFERVKFDGRGISPPARTEGLKVQVGLDVPETLGRKQRNKRPAVFSILQMDNCTFSNFLFFATILGNSPGTADDEDEVRQFPYINGMDIQFVNRLDIDPTFALIRGCNFSDIDRTAVYVRYANFTLFENAFGERCGGRSLDTPATYWFEANSRSPNAAIYLLNNNLTQTRPVTYPFLGDLTVPAYQTLVWVTGLRDQAIFDCLQNESLTIDDCLSAVFPTCCPAVVITGNFWCGLPYGLRFVGEQDPLIQYILDSVPGMPVPIFDDVLSALREVALVNNVSIDGTVCDIVLGAPDKDWRKENLCCDEACPPRPPTNCRINSTDPRTIDPAHPYHNIYFFDDINTCMELCQTTSRQCDLEWPSDDAHYEVRINASVMQPPVLTYKATWSGPVWITVVSTLPMAGLVSPPAVSIPIDWTDVSLPPVMIEIVPMNPLFASISIEVTGNLQMPANIPEAVPTETPVAWPMTIDITYTFCAPANMVAPIPSFAFSFNYTSPAVNVNTPSFDYAAVLIIEWEWNATAQLQTATGLTLNGVGVPVIECNGHSPQGADITVKNVKFQHGDPCVDATLDPDTCPCTVAGLATWQQSDATPVYNLRLLSNSWDGQGYAALAIDGEFWNRTDVRKSVFVDYALANPGYVVRLLPSTTQDCCAQPCKAVFYAVDNTFLGSDSLSMTGNLVLVGPAEIAHIDKNTAVDAGAQDTFHPEAALFYVRTCPGLPISGSMSENSAQRTAGVALQTRVPPNDCYWTVAEADELSVSGGFKMERNVQLITYADGGAPVCLRPINWPASSPGTDCQRAVRNLRAANLECDGSLADVWTGACDSDVCLARLLGCPGVDPACDAITVPPCSPNDECMLCNGNCGRPVFDPPTWFILLTAFLVAILLCCFLYCCGCCTWLCCLAWPYKIYTHKHQSARPISSLDEKSALRYMAMQQ